jgi:hypothetical protein
MTRCTDTPQRGRPREFDAEEAKARHRKAALEHWNRVGKARRAQRRQEARNAT